jgi:hypothetical protein
MSVEMKESIQGITVSMVNSNADPGRIDWWIEIPVVSDGYVSIPMGYEFHPFSPLVRVKKLEWTVGGDPLLAYEMSVTNTVKRVLPAMYESFDPIWHWTKTGRFKVQVDATADVYQDGRWETEHRQSIAWWTIHGPEVKSLTTKSVRPEYFEPSDQEEIYTYWASMGWISANKARTDLNDPGFIMRAEIFKQPSDPDGTLRCVQLVKPYRVTIHNNGEQSELIRDSFDLDLSDEPPAYDDDEIFICNEIYTTSDSPANELLPTDRSLVWDDKYKMYFMFKADYPGSIWVTLCRVDWEIDVRVVDGTWIRNEYPNKNTGGRGTITDYYTELPEWTRTVSSGDATRHLNLNSLRFQYNAEIFALIQSYTSEGIESDIETKTGRKSCLDNFTIGNKNYSLFWGPKSVLTSSKLPLKELIEYPFEHKYRYLNMDHLTQAIYRVDIAPFCFGPSIEYWRDFAYADPLNEKNDFSPNKYIERMRQAFPSGHFILVSEKEMIVSFDTIPEAQILRGICRHPQTFFIDDNRA